MKWLFSLCVYQHWLNLILSFRRCAAQQEAICRPICPPSNLPMTRIATASNVCLCVFSVWICKKLFLRSNQRLKWIINNEKTKTDIQCLTGIIRSYGNWSQNVLKTSQNPETCSDCTRTERVGMGGGDRATVFKERRRKSYFLFDWHKKMDLVVDWWRLRKRKVTWRQARSQSQGRAWGTLSNLQTGGLICLEHKVAHKIMAHNIILISP